MFRSFNEALLSTSPRAFYSPPRPPALQILADRLGMHHALGLHPIKFDAHSYSLDEHAPSAPAERAHDPTDL
jgi:hypothetical protein